MPSTSKAPNGVSPFFKDIVEVCASKSPKPAHRTNNVFLNTIANSKAIVVSQLHPSTSSDNVVLYMATKLGLDAGHNITARALIPKGKTTSDLNFVSVLVNVPETLCGREISLDMAGRRLGP